MLKKYAREKKSGNEQDRALLVKHLKITFWVMFMTTAICLLIPLVIDVKTIKHSIQTIITNKMKPQL